MKKMNTYRILSAAFAALALLAVSCTKPEPEENTGNTGNGGNKEEVKKEEPSFPNLVEDNNVQPGSTLTLTFKPNYDWKISVPADIRQWFWIVDGSFKVSELSGKASESSVTVKIGVTENQEFDKNYSCEVTMAMDGKTKVIAKYMLPAKERTMSVYAAEWDADALKVADDGTSYVYSSTAADALELKWSAADADFRAPVKVDANCEWSVELPEWASVNVPESTVGSVNLVFTGESLDGASGEIVFKAGDSVLKTMAVTVPAAKDMAVYSAKISEGEFEYGGDGYVWSESPVDDITMAWMGSDFRMPVLVDSKCNWSIELPEWLTADIPEKTAGKFSFTLMGIPSKYPLTDTAGKIVFKSGSTVIKEMTVNMPGCQDIMSFSVDMSLTALEYNHIGEVNTSIGYVEGPATGRLSGVKDVRVFAVETTGGKVGKEPEWFNIEISAWNTASDADVIQDRTLTFLVTENTGAARSAVLFVLPPTITADASELLGSDGSVKEAYESFAVSVTQASADYDEYISVNQTADYTFEKASSAKADELTAALGATDFVYVMTYSTPYSRDNAFMTMAVPFSSYKIFSSDNLSSDKSSSEGFWLTYTNGGDSNNYGVIDMYKDMELPAESSVGYVVFYNASSEVLAIVECVSPKKEEEVTPPVEEEGTYEDADGDKVVPADDYLVDADAAAAAGAVLVRIVGGPTYDIAKEEISQGAVALKLTLPADTPVEVSLPKACKYYQMPQALSSYINVNGEDYYETSGMLDAAIRSAAISMTKIEETVDVIPFVKFHQSTAQTYPFLIVYLSLK